MDADAEDMISRIAAAIGEPARARILCCLMDSRARTSTELAAVAGVSASTASAHMLRLRSARLVRLHAQGKHRYYSLGGPEVARVLEGLHILAGQSEQKFVPSTPPRLRVARTCYDHIAGTLGVALHDRLVELRWLSPQERSYDLTAEGAQALQALGIDVEATSSLRRKLAFGCLDWSERRCHLGGALGAALLALALTRKWVMQDLDGRALSISRTGQRELHKSFGLSLRGEVLRRGDPDRRGGTPEASRRTAGR
jgi:DNA-binding transcriptional ArsR family regulator